MLTFDIGHLVTTLHQISLLSMWLPENTSDDDYDERHNDALEDFQMVAELCTSIGLKECADQALRHKRYAEQHKDNPKGIHALCEDLSGTIGTELEKRRFLWVRPSHSVLIDNDRSFG